MNRALVVGIGNYGRLGRPLPGCANDLAGWRDQLAATLGVSGAGLRVRGDAEATRSVLLDDLRWLLSNASAGDQRVFFFAGHGARLRRRDPATGLIDDMLDESLVTYPEASDDQETYMLFDRDLAELIDGSGFPASARLTLFVDACHSGGIIRDWLVDEDSPFPRCWVPDQELRARIWEPIPLALARGLEGVSNHEEEAVLTRVRSLGSLESVTVSRVIVEAARPEQSAWDARMPNGQRHGVFSYHALNALSAQPAISFNALITAVTPPIAASYPQNPMLLGDTSRFSGRIFN